MNALNLGTNPLVFNYYQEDYEKWVTDFGNHIKAITLADRIEYPKNFAAGYAKAKNVEPGLSYRIVNYTLHTDLECMRTAANELHLMLYFYEIQFDEKVYCKTGSTIIESNDKYYSIALMTNSLTPQHLRLKKGTIVKGLSVQLSEAWLKENIKDLTPEKLEMIKQKDCITDFISAKQRKVLNDIFISSEQSLLPGLFIKSRVLRLTEQFLTRLCHRGLTNMPEFANLKDFQAIVKVEHLLLKNFSADFPSIEALAKTAYMSKSKLKKLFKKAYGMAIYQYYQKNRMHKAKELLGSRKHNISQVGAMLGYQNLSNFSVAFKKEFSYLPSEIQEIL
ncbi:helix-turn-helix domain-containing protein [Ferruginibacter sp. SUN106]|uniref:helix-turn-helix domain-containing protein n=1 Tax=Ferruginibacter sp. SUN106 TaxID=2978348 RepID=UPI003D362FBF